MSSLMNGHAALASGDPFTEGLFSPDRAASGELESLNGEASGGNAGSASSGGGGGGGSSSYYMAMPQLMGAPAYARPPRLVAESPRPLDPDDLPIEALRSPEDEALLSATYQEPIESEPTLEPSSQGGLRAVAAKLFGSGS
jgi:hypothetical protein